MSKRILVVKDQEDNRQIIRDMLAGTENCALRAKSSNSIWQNVWVLVYRH